MSKKVLMMIAGSVGAVATIAVIGFLIAAALGYVYVGAKKPSEKAGATYATRDICSEDIVKKYNDALKQQDAKAIDSALGGISADIAKKPRYEESPDCVYMRLTHAIGAGNVDDVKSLGRTLDDLGGQGRYTTGRLYNAMSLEAVMAMVEQFGGGSSSEKPAGNG